MNKTSFTTTSHVDSNSSMSSFMSGLLAERASRFALPSAKWSINIVDDNARPKYIDKSRIKMLQQRRNSQPNKDLRWGSSSGENTVKGSSADNSVCSQCETGDSKQRFSQDHRYLSGDSSRGVMRQSTPSTNNISRFDSSKALPPIPGLRRAAASDTMLLKMPVRTTSPGTFNAKRSLAAVSQANAKWGSPQHPKRLPPRTDMIAGLSNKLPNIDLHLDEKLTASTTTSPLESDFPSNRSSSSEASSSNNNNLSRSKMSRSTNSMTHSTSLGMNNNNNKSNHSNTSLYRKNKRDKPSKKKNKSSKSSGSKGGNNNKNSSSSLKQRASLLGLDLR